MGVFKSTWRHIRRSPYQAFAAISIMTLTFMVSGLFFVLSIGSTVVLRFFEQKPQIIVFFKDTKSEEDIRALENKLKSMEEVAQVKYVSKVEALEIYKEQFKNDPLLLEMVSAEILPASLEVSATKIEQLKPLAKDLAQEEDVQEIVAPEDVIDLLVSWTTNLRKIGLFLVVFLGIVSVVTIFTVTSMKIALKREELEILQLVGATKSYIRLPFVTEGILYGLIGATLGWMFNVVLLIYTAPTLSSLFVGIPLFPVPLVFYAEFLLAMMLGGVILGGFASFLALSRYLHHKRA